MPKRAHCQALLQMLKCRVRSRLTLPETFYNRPSILDLLYVLSYRSVILFYLNCFGNWQISREFVITRSKIIKFAEEPSDARKKRTPSFYSA